MFDKEFSSFFFFFLFLFKVPQRFRNILRSQVRMPFSPEMLDLCSETGRKSLLRNCFSFILLRFASPVCLVSHFSVCLYITNEDSRSSVLLLVQKRRKRIEVRKLQKSVYLMLKIINTQAMFMERMKACIQFVWLVKHFCFLREIPCQNSVFLSGVVHTEGSQTRAMDLLCKSLLLYKIRIK